MKLRNSNGFEDSVQNLIRQFIKFIRGRGIQRFQTDSPFYVPRYSIDENQSSLVLDSGRLYDSHQIAKEFGIQAASDGSLWTVADSLGSELSNEYHSLDRLTSVISGFFHRIIDATNPIVIDKHRLQRYLPFLHQQLRTDRVLEWSRSLIYPIISGVRNIEIGSGMSIRRLYHDEFTDDWEAHMGDIWRRCETKGPVAEYSFEHIYPRKSIDEVSSPSFDVFISPHLRLIQTLRIVGRSGVGYARLLSGPLFHLHALHSSSHSPGSELLYVPNPPTCVIDESTLEAVRGFWLQFKDHTLVYLDNAARLFTKAMSLTDPELRFLLLMVVLESLFRRPIRNSEVESTSVLYRRLEKVLEAASWKKTQSRSFVNQIRYARNSLVHEGEIGRKISGRDSLRTPNSDLIRNLIKVDSDSLKVVVGIGPVNQKDMLSIIDSLTSKQLVDSLPEWHHGSAE